MWLTLGTLGNHTFVFELDNADAEAIFALVVEAMNSEPITVRGHVLVRPEPGTQVALRLGDIVTAELSGEQPPSEEKG